MKISNLKPRPLKIYLYLGILGTITKTAESTECPGKCIHALASLLCDEVREEISCPQEGLRCCVDRRRPSNRPPPPQQQTSQQTSTTTSEEQTTEDDPATTTRKKKKKKKSPTTERTGADIPASMKSVSIGYFNVKQNLNKRQQL